MAGCREVLDERPLADRSVGNGYCLKDEGRRLETFTEPRVMVENALYPQERRAALEALDLHAIDAPIVDIVRTFAALPYCFSLQSCWGHFICAPEQDPHTLEPVPVQHPGSVRYRIAYVGLCIENCHSGRGLMDSLTAMTAIDPDYLQFGSADWFWERWLNSYALQVEPARYMTRDDVVLSPAEALHVQHTRDLFFSELRKLLAREVGEHRAG